MNLTDKESLLNAIKEACDVTTCNYCFFIDGLDEYESSKSELVETIRSLVDIASKGVKICLAGRPEPDLGDLLHTCPMIRMQDHNTPTMHALVRRKIELQAEKDINFDSKFPPKLRYEMVDKAHGVIL